LEEKAVESGEAVAGLSLLLPWRQGRCSLFSHRSNFPSTLNTHREKFPRCVKIALTVCILNVFKLLARVGGKQFMKPAKPEFTKLFLKESLGTPSRHTTCLD